MNEVIQLILESLIPIGVGGGIGWVFHRYKHKAEVKGLEAQAKGKEVDNAQKIIDLYQEALNDLKKNYEGRFADLQKEIDSLRNNVELWKKKYRDLKKAFDEYREKREETNITPGDGE